MLVCNVSLRPRGRAIAAELAETSAAVDALATGNVVFATLVDDPASVGEIVDAYLGEIMLEAASASEAADAGFILNAAIAEAVTAGDTQDSTVTAAIAVAWDATTAALVTLSGGDLVATSTGTTQVNQGIRVGDAYGRTAGKYYFEITLTTLKAGANAGLGIGTITSIYSGMGGAATVGSMVFTGSGNIWSNSGNTGISLAARATGNVIGIAIDLDNRKAWFRVAPSGNWNNSGTANPATNVGGITIPAGTMVPFNTFGGTSGVSGQVWTANFGASGFTGAVPSGFTSGWT